MADIYQQKSEGRQGLPLPGIDRRPLVTWVLLAVNVGVWLAMERAGGSREPEVLLDFGALFGPYIANGEYWRLFTAMFLHVGLVHLLFNGLGLLIFGRMVERLYGHTRFAIIYVVAGLSGSVASYLLNSVAIGAGASGAIFGVLGALAAFFTARRDMLGEMGRQNLMGLLLMAAVNLLFGFITPGIDNWAHMGGLVGGFAVGLAFAPEYRHVTSPYGVAERLKDTNSVARRWWVLPAAAAALFAAVSLGTSTLDDNPLSHLLRAERHLEKESYDLALEEIGQALQLDPTIGQAHYLRGKALASLGDVRGARSELGTAMRLGLDPKTRREAISLLLILDARQ